MKEPTAKEMKCKHAKCPFCTLSQFIVISSDDLTRLGKVDEVIKKKKVTLQIPHDDGFIFILQNYYVLSFTLYEHFTNHTFYSTTGNNNIFTFSIKIRKFCLIFSDNLFQLFISFVCVSVNIKIHYRPHISTQLIQIQYICRYIYDFHLFSCQIQILVRLSITYTIYK